MTTDDEKMSPHTVGTNKWARFSAVGIVGSKVVLACEISDIFNSGVAMTLQLSAVTLKTICILQK